MKESKPIIAIAPMMGYTDRHFRYLLRLISPHVRLYTEMITAKAIIHGDRHKLLTYHSQEHPVAIQLGGCDPQELAESAKIAEDFGYDEVNLNVGCPSERVKKGQFGACLMRQPDLVAECVDAMQNAVSIPVTVKTRLGVDHHDSYPFLINFIEKVASAGCRCFIIHARKAWLKGLNPKQNREIPPLQYEKVYQLKRDFPLLEIISNGGYKEMDTIKEALKHVDGVMIGREACHNPYFLADIERTFYEANIPSRTDVLDAYITYMNEEISKGVKPLSLQRHLINLWRGEKGAKVWRRQLSQGVSIIPSFVDFLHA